MVGFNNIGDISTLFSNGLRGSDISNAEAFARRQEEDNRERRRAEARIQVQSKHERDLYGLLGVSKGASLSEIKSAFKELSKLLHPDKGGESELFKRINAAYATLKDDVKRSDYDESLEEASMRGDSDIPFCETESQELGPILRVMSGVGLSDVFRKEYIGYLSQTHSSEFPCVDEEFFRIEIRKVLKEEVEPSLRGYNFEYSEIKQQPERVGEQRVQFKIECAKNSKKVFLEFLDERIAHMSEFKRISETLGPAGQESFLPAMRVLIFRDEWALEDEELHSLSMASISSVTLPPFSFQAIEEPMDWLVSKNWRVNGHKADVSYGCKGSGNLIINTDWSEVGAIADGRALPRARGKRKPVATGMKTPAMASESYIEQLKSLLINPPFSESLELPIWKEKRICYACKWPFLWPVRPRHHCRRCGESFCGNHAKCYAPLPELVADGSVHRMCHNCALASRTYAEDKFLSLLSTSRSNDAVLQKALDLLLNVYNIEPERLLRVLNERTDGEPLVRERQRILFECWTFSKEEDNEKLQNLVDALDSHHTRCEAIGESPEERVGSLLFAILQSSPQSTADAVDLCDRALERYSALRNDVPYWIEHVLREFKSESRDIGLVLHFAELARKGYAEEGSNRFGCDLELFSVVNLAKDIIGTNASHCDKMVLIAAVAKVGGFQEPFSWLQFMIQVPLDSWTLVSLVYSALLGENADEAIVEASMEVLVTENAGEFPFGKNEKQAVATLATWALRRSGITSPLLWSRVSAKVLRGSHDLQLTRYCLNSAVTLSDGVVNWIDVAHVSISKHRDTLAAILCLAMHYNFEWELVIADLESGGALAVARAVRANLYPFFDFAGMWDKRAREARANKEPKLAAFSLTAKLHEKGGDDIETGIDLAAALMEFGFPEWGVDMICVHLRELKGENSPSAKLLYARSLLVISQAMGMKFRDVNDEISAKLVAGALVAASESYSDANETSPHELRSALEEKLEVVVSIEETKQAVAAQPFFGALFLNSFDLFAALMLSAFSRRDVFSISSFVFLNRKRSGDFFDNLPRPDKGAALLSEGILAFLNNDVINGVDFFSRALSVACGIEAYEDLVATILANPSIRAASLYAWKEKLESLGTLEDFLALPAIQAEIELPNESEGFIFKDILKENADLRSLRRSEAALLGGVRKRDGDFEAALTYIDVSQIAPSTYSKITCLIQACRLLLKRREFVLEEKNSNWLAEVGALDHTIRLIVEFAALVASPSPMAERSTSLVTCAAILAKTARQQTRGRLFSIRKDTIERVATLLRDGLRVSTVVPIMLQPSLLAFDSVVGGLVRRTLTKSILEILSNDKARGLLLPRELWSYYIFEGRYHGWLEQELDKSDELALVDSNVAQKRASKEEVKRDFD